MTRSNAAVRVRRLVGGMLLVLAALASLGLVVRALAPRKVEFATVHECSSFYQQRGYFLNSGCSDSKAIANTCLISAKQLHREQIAALHKYECGLTPAWKGVVWVSVVNNGGFLLSLDTLGGHWRMWGDLVAAGDPQLLDELETVYFGGQRPAESNEAPTSNSQQLESGEPPAIN